MHPTFSLQIFRVILVCLKGNEKLAIWQRQHGGFDPSLTTGISPSCSNMSSVLSNKTSSYLTVPMSSIFMAARKHRFEVMKLQSKILMGKLSCAPSVNLQSHTSTISFHFWMSGCQADDELTWLMGFYSTAGNFLNPLPNTTIHEQVLSTAWRRDRSTHKLHAAAAPDALFPSF